MVDIQKQEPVIDTLESLARRVEFLEEQISALDRVLTALLPPGASLVKTADGEVLMAPYRVN